MDESKKGIGHKGLVTALVILCVVAVVIAVAIIFVNISGSHNQGIQREDSAVLPEELQGDNLSPEDQVIKETTLMMGESDSETDIVAYYDSAIQKALDGGDTQLAARIVVQKMDFLVSAEEGCVKAKKYLDGLNISSYSVEDKEYIMSYVRSLAIDCDDQELRAEVNEYYGVLEENEK